MAGMNRKRMTPDMRCRTETIAMTGNLNLNRLRLTGLSCFTENPPYKSMKYSNPQVAR